MKKILREKKKGKIRRKIKNIEENIWNVPNALTLIRVLITLLIIGTIFFDFNLVSIIILFSIGMITDFLDGNIARLFNLKTEFGRKFDMAADRFLLIGTVLSLILYQAINGNLSSSHILQILMIMSREIIAFPIAIYALVSKKPVPHAKVIGKITTVLQAVSFPAILFNLNFSIYLAVLTGIVGIFSAITYIKDILDKK